MELKPYPAYKHADVPWLQQVPEHWGMIPNRGLVRKRKVLVGTKHKEYQLLSLTKQGIIVRDLSTGKGKFSADMGTSQEVRKGDLVFCLFDVPETPRTVGLSSHDGMITGAYTVFESIGSGSAEYFDYFYRAMDDRKLLGPLYSGLRNTIPLDRLLVAKTPQPPLDEQHLIVRYLHALDAKVKRYIRTKRSLIARLQEQKQAIIQRAVTRGLDPNVKLKASGVEWLGEVPKHWEVLAVKRFSSVIGGFAFPADAFTKSGSGIRVIRMSNLKCGVIDATDAVSVPQSMCLPAFALRANDILYGLSGSIGNFAMVREEDLPLQLNQRVAVLRPRSEMMLARFLHYLIQTEVFSAQVMLKATGTAQMNVSTGQVQSVFCPVPQVEEQLLVLQHLDAATKQFDHALLRIKREIENMQEYHTRLIADVVTGAVDVRAAAQAPPEQPMDQTADEPMEEEPLSMAAEREETYENE